MDDASGQVAHTFKPQTFKVAAGAAQTITLSDAWPDPRLWWPDTPNLYRLRTTIVVGGREFEVSDTLFGFREWRRKGTKFTLNGVVWHLWADLIGEDYFATGINPADYAMWGGEVAFQGKAATRRRLRSIRRAKQST